MVEAGSISGKSASRAWRVCTKQRDGLIVAILVALVGGPLSLWCGVPVSGLAVIITVASAILGVAVFFLFHYLYGLVHFRFEECGGLRKFLREQLGGMFWPVVGMSGGILFSMLFSAASFALIVTKYNPSVASGTAPAEKKLPEFVKEQRVYMQFNPSASGDAVTYHAFFSATGPRSRFFIEYSQIDFPLQLPSQPNRVLLKDIRDFARGDDVTITVVTRVPDPKKPGNSTFWFGDPKNNFQFYVGNYRARIVVTDDVGNEQYYYFLLVPGVRRDDAVSYPDVIPKDLTYFDKWEASSRK